MPNRPTRAPRAASPGSLLVVAALALGLVLAPPALAQDDTPQARREAAKALIKTTDELMGPQKLKGVMTSAIRTPLEQQIKQASHLSFQQRDRAVAVMSEAMVSETNEMLASVMPAMYAAMEDIYVERFTLPELLELQRFYDSSAGRKSITVLQDDMGRLMQPMMQTAQSRQDRLRQRIDAAVQQLRKEGIELQPPKR